MAERKSYRDYLKENGIPIKYDLKSKEDIALFRKKGAEQYGKLYDFLNLKEGDRVLEVGFHYGAFIEFLNGKGIIPDAIELDEKKYEMLRNDGALDANWFLGDANDFLIDKSRCYDYVFLNYVLEHIPPTLCVPFLGRIQESLEIGGILSVTVPNMENPYNIRLMYCEPTHVNGFTMEKLIWAFYNSGFDEIVCKDPHSYENNKLVRIREHFDNMAKLMEIRSFNDKNSETLLCYGEKKYERSEITYGPYDF